MPPKKEKVKKSPATKPIEYRYTPKPYFPLPVATQSHNTGAPATTAASPASKEKERADRQNAVRFLQETFKGRVDPTLVQSILEDSGWREDLATETLIKIGEESSASELQCQYDLGSRPGAAGYWSEILQLDPMCDRFSDDLDERTSWLSAGLTQPTAPQLSSSASPSLRSLACQEGAIGSSSADSAFVERTLLQAASRLELQNRVLVRPDDNACCRQASPPCQFASPRQQQQHAKSTDDDDLYNDLDCRLRLSAGTTPRDRLADSGECAAGSFKNILASDESCEPSEPNALSWRSSAGSSLSACSSLQGGADASQVAPAMQRSLSLQPALNALSLSPPSPQQPVKSPAWMDVHYIQLDQGDIVLEKGTFVEQRSDAAVVCCPPLPGDADSRSPMACSQLASMGTSTVGSTAESGTVQSNPADAQDPRIAFDLGLRSCDVSTTSGSCYGVSSSGSSGDCGSATWCESESRDDSSGIGRSSGKPSSCGIAQLSGAGLPKCTTITADLLQSSETLVVDSLASSGPAKGSDSSAKSLGSSGIGIVSVTASNGSSCSSSRTTAAAAAAAPPAAAAAATCALASAPALNAGLLHAALPPTQNQQQFRPAAQAAPVSPIGATAASSSPTIYSLGASAAYMNDRSMQLPSPAKSWSSLASACAQSAPSAWSAPLDHKRSGLSTQPPCHERAGRNSSGVSAESSLKKLVADIRQSSSRGKKILVLLRGCPGSGKSYLARHLKGEKGVVLSTDDFFMINGRYEYDYGRIGEAHDWNRKRAEQALKDGVTPVVIDNTNTMIWEMGPYGSLALTYHYRLEICEPATEWRFNANELYRANSHGVPLEAIQAMIERYEHNVKPLDVINFARRSQPPTRPPQLPVAARETVDTAEQLLTAGAQGLPQSSPRATDRFTTRPHSSDPAAQAAAVDDLTAAPAITTAAGLARPLAVSRNKMTSQTIRRNCLTPDVEKLRNKDFGNSSPTSPDTDSTLVLSPVKEPSPSVRSLPNAPALSSAPPSATNDAATTVDTAVTKSLPAHVLDNGAHIGGVSGRRNIHTSVGVQSGCDSSTTVLGVLDVCPQLPGDRSALCSQSLSPETVDQLPEPFSADVRSTSLQCSAVVLDDSTAATHRQPHKDEPAEQRRTADDMQVGSKSCEEPSLLPTAVLAAPEAAAPETAASRQQTLAASASSPASQLHQQLAASLCSPTDQPPRPAACAAAVSSSAYDFAQPASSMAAAVSPLATSSHAATADVANCSLYDSKDDARRRVAAFTMVEPGDFALVAGLLSTSSLVGSNGKLATKCAADSWRVVVAAADAHRRPSDSRTAALRGSTQDAGAARRSFAYSAAVSFDKSTMTDDDEVAADAGGEELLSSLFPQVSLENLRDVLKVCKGSVSWATNTLLDSGCDYADFSTVPSPKVPSAQPVLPAAGRAATAAKAQRFVAENTEKRHLSLPYRGKKRPTYRKLAPKSWASFYSPPRGTSSRCVHVCYSGTCAHPEHSSLAASTEPAASAATAGSAFSKSDEFVTLTLTSESILRLIELFGSLGSEAAGAEELELLCGAGAFDVQLPLGLAEQLHGTIKRAAEGVRQWKRAVPCNAAHLGGSWSANQLPADWSHSAQGTGPADGLVHCLPDTAGDEELARRLQLEENSGGIVLPPPLCEIMDAQLAEQVEQEQQQAKSAFGGSQYQMLTMAERLRRQKLYDVYPTQASSYLDSVFDSCGRNLERAIDALGNAAVVSAAIEQGAALISSTAEDIDDEWEDMPDEPVVQVLGRSSLVAPDQLYLNFRAQASHHLALKKEFIRKAIEARGSDRTTAGPVVGWYMRQARNHAAQARRCNEVAAQRIFEARNPPTVGRDREKEGACASSSERLQQLPKPLVMDLHGLHASEAVSRVRSAIESVRAEFERQPDRRLRRLTLITGKGTNSRAGVPRVKQAVIAFLQQKNIAFSEVNEGVLKVNLYRLPDASTPT